MLGDGGQAIGRDAAGADSLDGHVQQHAHDSGEELPVILTMHDRAEREDLTYTHEFLAHVLGATRKSVTLAAQARQKECLISFHRGDMQILDRPLEKASCECNMSGASCAPTRSISPGARAAAEATIPISRPRRPRWSACT